MGDGLDEVGYVVVHAGARDAYNVARALSEAGLLDTFVTDFMWSGWTRSIKKLLPQKVALALLRRAEDHIPRRRVRNSLFAAVQSFLLDGAKWLPFSIRQQAVRSSDARLGRKARKIAIRHGAGLLTYSYYAFDALAAFPRGGVLFQVHPHPLSVRRLLQRELEDHPECAPSLRQEWELSLPAEDFARLVEEPNRASRFLCASSFTRATLIENGADPTAIRVIPYGVDCSRFRPEPGRRSQSGPLQLLFVGRINQRKGVKYLVEALRAFHAGSVHLTICGRVVDDLSIFQTVADRITIRPSVSAAELTAAYQAADMFVFPSVVEGFGQVLLEALASGLPLLTTRHTAGPDLIRQEEEGFIVDPRSSDMLIDRIDWAASHRRELTTMQQRARERAQNFTWERFREGVVQASRTFAQELYVDES